MIYFTVGEMGVGATGVGEMGQIIGNMGIGEMGVNHDIFDWNQPLGNAGFNDEDLLYIKGLHKNFIFGAWYMYLHIVL